MTISQLVKSLERAKERLGDVEVMFADSEHILIEHQIRAIFYEEDHAVLTE